jgi:hypothetical protein
MSVTLEVFQLPTPLLKLVAPLNIEFIEVTDLVSHVVISPLKLAAFENKLSILPTEEVSQVDKP